MATFGKNILENLTTGMYYDSKVIYREYIQNACDQIDKAVQMGLIPREEASVDIEINYAKRTITISDNATGIPMNDFQHQLQDIANSDKVRGVDKGFRGIGRLCGLAYCKTLTFTSTYPGEDSRSIMRMDAKKMREMLDSPTKYSVDDILDAITSFSSEPAGVEEHGFTVILEGINNENTDLLNKNEVESYLSFVAPVPYNSKFRLRQKIYEHADSVCHKIDEYRIFVQGNQVFKNYGMRLYDKANSSGGKKAYDEFWDVAFHDIKKDGKLIAWMWYGLCRFDKAIPKAENPMYGFRVRQSNIQIGDNTILSRFFKEDRGNSYFVGEVFVVSPQLTPNSQRDNFNENEIRVFFEKEIKAYCYDTLHKLYNMAARLKNQYKRLGEYTALVEELDRKTQTGFVDAKEQETLRQKVAEAAVKKEEAQKAIDKLPTVSTETDSPTAIVQHAIKTYFDKKDTEKKAEAAAKKEAQLTQTEPSKPKLFTDSLSKLTKSDRKLILRVLGIVGKHVSEEEMQKIKSDIEKEYR